ncbi:hypothetical protein [Campylobacter concisus]|nr:hypothetical protein [Campylobacter concisus]QPH94537.1 hypothetical protein CVT07_09075 [Campylobacter concisus]
MRSKILVNFKIYEHVYQGKQMEFKICKKPKPALNLNFIPRLTMHIQHKL